MNITFILFEKSQKEELVAQNWIPDHFADRMEQHLIIGGMNEEKVLVSIAIYSISKNRKKSADLSFIFVLKPYQGQGIARQMLEECKRLLTYMGYVPNPKKEYLVSYRFSQLDENMLEKSEKIPPKILDSSLKITQYDDPNLKIFMKQTNDQNYFFTKKDYQPELCRFYMEDGRIRAAILLYRMKDGGICCLKPYLSPKLKNKNILPYLASVHYHELRKIVEPETKMVVRFSHPKTLSVYQNYINGEKRKLEFDNFSLS